MYPKISIITPIFNGERFIESCLLNVINQECPSIEHIIIDAGSQDGTVAILEKYANRYSHIRWLSEKDKGQSDAMNKGIALAQGEIIGILNVDDYYEPGTLNQVIVLFNAYQKATFLVANCKLWDDFGKLVWYNKPQKLDFDTIYINVFSGNFLKNGGHLFPFNPSAYFYHKRIHNIIGLYDVEDHYTMDLDFILSMLKAPVIQVQYVDEHWGNYRQISGSKTVLQFQAGNSETNLRNVIGKHFNKERLLSRWRLKMKLILFKNSNSIFVKFLLKLKRKFSFL